VVGKTRCKVARRMAQWASLQDDEQQEGAGESNTPINLKAPSSNNEIPHPLMDCGQGKNKNENNDPATVRMSDEVGVGGDVAVVLALTWQVERMANEQGTERLTQRGTTVPRTYPKR
jgi:hypothetical protein